MINLRALDLSFFGLVVISLSLVGCGAGMESAGSGGSSTGSPSSYNMSGSTKMPLDYLAKSKLSCKRGKCNAQEKAVGLLLIEKSKASASKNIELGWCTGTLITKRHVLTAGHCVMGQKNKEIKNSAIHFLLPNQSKVYSVAFKKVELTEMYDSFGGIDPQYEGYPDQAIIELSEDVVGVTPIRVDEAGFKLPTTVVAAVVNLKNDSLSFEEYKNQSQQVFEYVVDSVDCRLNKESYLSIKDVKNRTLPILGLYGCPIGKGNSGGAILVQESQSNGIKLVAHVIKTRLSVAGFDTDESMFYERQRQMKEYYSKGPVKFFIPFDELTSEKKNFFVSTARKTSCIDLSTAGLKESGACQPVGPGMISQTRSTTKAIEVQTEVSDMFAKQTADLQKQISHPVLQSKINWSLRAELSTNVEAIRAEGEKKFKRDVVAVYPVGVCHEVGSDSATVMSRVRGGATSGAVLEVGFYDIAYGPWNRVDLIQSISGLMTSINSEFQGSATGTVMQWSSVFSNVRNDSFQKLSLVNGETQNEIQSCSIVGTGAAKTRTDAEVTSLATDFFRKRITY